MENFVVSARKYRPTTFESVVGQNTLTQTLKNAIKSNHLAHAYLFCGPRGIGKTTCARIFAKTINCQNLSSDYEACNECESCKAFNEQRSYNIHELDAASNNSVDDIRSLIEQVRIPPQIGHYSVYIVDEVHMLSSGAFNAFLKTLEEPPAHAIFILATTEKHKILPTILSRCQIYDFSRITVKDTVAHLQRIAEKEGVLVDMETLNIIAQKSDGGMRDALSIFDQLVSFCGNNITYQDTIQTLNVLDCEYYFRLVDICLKNDINNALLIFNEILNKGFDGQHFIEGLGSHLRDVLVSHDIATTCLLEVGENIATRYHHQAKQCTPEFLFKALQITNDCSLNYRTTRNKRLLIEITLIKLCQITNHPTPDKNENEHKPIQPLNAIQQIPAQAQTPPANIQPVAQATPQPASSPKNSHIGTTIPTSTISRPMSVSINNLQLNQEGSEIKQLSKTPSILQKEETFTEDNLRKVWLEQIVPLSADKYMAMILEKYQPTLQANNIIRLQVDNKSQVGDIQSIQEQIINVLRRELNNDLIKLQLSINEATDTEDTVYTASDKMALLTQKNPDLGLLRQQFNLLLE